jgi:hypothetical protein
MITAAVQAIAGLSLRTKVESIVVLVAVAGAGLWWVTRAPPPVPEVITAAPQVIQADKSVIAERAPDAHPPKPPHIIPKGYVEERRETVHVTTDVPKTDVEVDLSLVRNGNERRVIASSPDGTIVSALDIPIEAGLIPPPPLKWAAGLSYSTQRETGVWLEHDIGRLRLGAEVAKGAGKPRTEIRIGIAF